MKCLKLWEGHCKYDKSINGVAKFFRHHFLRAYYNNRAPIVFHLNTDWLKEFEIVNSTEIIPNVGYSKIEKTRINLVKKEYRNLDGVIKFINDTLVNNKDVYFVTAKKAIEWMKILPRLHAENLTDLIKNDLFDDCSIGADKLEFDGECSILKQVNPDYDERETLVLDDSHGEELMKKLKVDRSKNGVLADLQSEVLFVNNMVIYFGLALAILLVVIVIQDKYFS